MIDEGIGIFGWIFVDIDISDGISFIVIGAGGGGGGVCCCCCCVHSWGPFDSSIDCSIWEIYRPQSMKII
jgi:hypothetical protein